MRLKAFAKAWLLGALAVVLTQPMSSSHAYKLGNLRKDSLCANLCLSAVSDRSEFPTPLPYCRPLSPLAPVSLSFCISHQRNIPYFVFSWVKSSPSYVFQVILPSHNEIKEIVKTVVDETKRSHEIFVGKFCLASTERKSQCIILVPLNGCKPPAKGTFSCNANNIKRLFFIVSGTAISVVLFIALALAIEVRALHWRNDLNGYLENQRGLKSNPEAIWLCHASSKTMPLGFNEERTRFEILGENVARPNARSAQQIPTRVERSVGERNTSNASLRGRNTDSAYISQDQDVQKNSNMQEAAKARLILIHRQKSLAENKFLKVYRVFQPFLNLGYSGQNYQYIKSSSYDSSQKFHSLVSLTTSVFSCVNLQHISDLFTINISTIDKGELSSDNNCYENYRLYIGLAHVRKLIKILEGYATSRHNAGIEKRDKNYSTKQIREMQASLTGACFAALEKENLRNSENEQESAEDPLFTGTATMKTVGHGGDGGGGGDSGDDSSDNSSDSNSDSDSRVNGSGETSCDGDGSDDSGVDDDDHDDKNGSPGVPDCDDGDGRPEIPDATPASEPETPMGWQEPFVPREVAFSALERATNFFDTILGEGSFGAVYRGQLEVQGKAITVAVKAIKPPKNDKQAKSSVRRRQFFSEINALMKCDHPNIVKLLAYCVDSPGLCLIYEFVAGTTLREALSKKSLCPLSMDERLHIAADASNALKYLHVTCRLIHRDVKTSNFLLTENKTVKLADFGLSTFLCSKDSEDDESSFLSSRSVGTGCYMSPEAMKGAVSRKVDIYSFGMVLYEIASGLPPYSSSKTKDLAMYMKDLNKEKVDLAVMIDPRVRETAGAEEASLKLFDLAKECTDMDPTKRPSMVEIYRRLKELWSNFKHSPKKDYDSF